jgi:hypothetical protein
MRQIKLNSLSLTTGVIATLGLLAPALGHHSDAGVDMTSVVAFEGTVSEFGWRNPHVYVVVGSTDPNGETRQWSLQSGSTNVQARKGWRPDSVVAGERVAVRAHVAQDGRPYGILVSLVHEDGSNLPMGFTAQEASVRATSLEGKWMADRSRLVSYPGGIDGFFKAHLKLTEKAQAAMAEYDPLSADNPEAQCIGRPTPGALLSTNIYPLQFEFDEAQKILTIRTEFFDEVRTVYMDGRSHPANGPRSHSGHSIGWWDDETLVVDTTLFSDHRSPYQIGVPSGAQKHVVERYRLIGDGSRAMAEFVLEDPEFLTEPMTHSRELIYTPDVEMFRFNCDADVTRRFVRP